jgi:hypothetical protein
MVLLGRAVRNQLASPHASAASELAETVLADVDAPDPRGDVVVECRRAAETARVAGSSFVAREWK